MSWFCTERMILYGKMVLDGKNDSLDGKMILHGENDSLDGKNHVKNRIHHNFNMVLSNYIRKSMTYIVFYGESQEHGLRAQQ